MSDPFEVLSSKLFAIAYRMLGSATEAEDIVQDAYLRWQTVDRTAIESPEAFLRSVVVHLCLDTLRSARVRHEMYPGIWLPEPILTEVPAEFADPGERVTETESVSLAFLLLLESLSPDERTIFLLHEVFEYDYDEIAPLVDKSNAACRQIFSRAKKHLAAHQPRFHASADQHRQLLTQFMQAIQYGEMDGLMSLLAEDANAYADGGGKAIAALHPIIGRAKLVRFLLHLMKRYPPDMRFEIAIVNGQEAFILREGEQIDTVLAFETTATAIQSLYFIRNPDKLTHL